MKKNIIIFTGAGQSNKLFNYDFINNKYVKNNLVDKLKKIADVFIPDIKYKNLYHYQKNDIYNQTKYFKPIKNLSLDDITIENTIKNISINEKQKYIVMGFSDGIYFAIEFARQYPKNILEIISLDGSWISTKLCKIRLTNWKNKGKKVSYIKTQKKLDEIVRNVIDTKDITFIKQIMDHKRKEHTDKCIKYKYENIVKKHKLTLFRDFNSDVNNKIDKEFNEYAILENNILKKLSKNYKVFWMVDGGHMFWTNEMYKKQLYNYIKQL